LSCTGRDLGMRCPASYVGCRTCPAPATTWACCARLRTWGAGLVLHRTHLRRRRPHRGRGRASADPPRGEVVVGIGPATGHQRWPICRHASSLLRTTASPGARRLSLRAALPRDSGHAQSSATLRAVEARSVRPAGVVGAPLRRQSTLRMGHHAGSRARAADDHRCCPLGASIQGGCNAFELRGTRLARHMADQLSRSGIAKLRQSGCCSPLHLAEPSACRPDTDGSGPSRVGFHRVARLARVGR